MSAYLLAHVHIKEPSLWQRYTQQALPTIQASGGHVVTKDDQPQILAATVPGEAEIDVSIMLSFNSPDAIHDWYDSSAYQALIPLRDQAADVLFVITRDKH